MVTGGGSLTLPPGPPFPSTGTLGGGGFDSSILPIFLLPLARRGVAIHVDSLCTYLDEILKNDTPEGARARGPLPAPPS